MAHRFPKCYTLWTSAGRIAVGHVTQTGKRQGWELAVVSGAGPGSSVCLCSGASSLPSRASSLRLLPGAPRAHLEMEVLKFHQQKTRFSILAQSWRFAVRFFFTHKGRRGSRFLLCSPSQKAEPPPRSQFISLLGRRDRCEPRPGPRTPAEQDLPAPRSPRGGKEATDSRGALGTSGVYLLQSLGASLQCKKTKRTKNSWNNNYNFFLKPCQQLSVISLYFIF